MKKVFILGRLLGTMLLIFMVLMPFACKDAEAASDKFKVSISYGYNGDARYGRYTPITFNFTEVKENFTGSIAIYAGSMSPYMISKDIVLSKGEDKTISISARIENSTMSFEYDILNTKKKVVKDGKFNITSMYNDTIVYTGILSDDYQSLTYMNKISYDYNSMTTAVYKLDVKDIPDESYALDMFDIIVVNNFNSEKLDSTQIKAIEEWVKNGGCILFGSGENNNKTFAAFEDINNIVSLNSLDNRTLQNPKILTAEGQMILNSYIVSVNQKVENILLSDAGDAIISAFNYSNGRVGVAGFDLGLTNFSDNLMLSNSFYEDSLLNLITTAKMDYIYSDMNSSGMDYWQLDNMLSNNVNGEMPKVIIYVGILILYVLVLCPIIFIFLRKKDKTKYTFPALMGIAALTCIAIYACGYKTRFSNPYLNYVRIVNSDSTNSEEAMYLGIQAPDNDKYNVMVNGKYSVIPVSDDYFWYDDTINVDPREYNISMKMSSEGTDVGINNSAAFESHYFQLKKSVENVPEVEFNITSFDGKIVGTVVNNSDKRIEDAVIIINNNFIILGNLEAGEEVTLNNSWVSQWNNYAYNFADQVIKCEDTSIANRRKIALNNYVDNTLFSSVYGINKIIYFTESESEESIVVNSNYMCKGISMYISEININNIVDGKIYYPNIYAYTDEYDNSNYYYDINNNTAYFYDSTETSLTLRYSLMYDNLDEIKLSKSKGSGYYNVFSGNILIDSALQDGKSLDISDRLDEYISMDELKDYIQTDEYGENYLSITYEYTNSSGYIDGEIIYPIMSGKGNAE